MDRATTWSYGRGLAVFLAAAVLGSAVLSLLPSLILLGLPHGWEAATSWANIRLRMSWLVRVLVPAAVAAHLVVHLRHRSSARARRDHPPGPHTRGRPIRRGRDGGPGSDRRGGLHR